MPRRFLRDTASRTIRFATDESGSSAQTSSSSGSDVSKATVYRYMGLLPDGSALEVEDEQRASGGC